MRQYFEKPHRSLIKAFSYRVLGSTISIIIAYVITKRWDFSFGVGLADLFIKTTLFYAHERFWNKISWGRRSVKPAVLWFTGLSGAGKTTLAEKLYNHMKTSGYAVDYLDGDAIRDVFVDRGFSKDERKRHLKIMGFMASHLEKSGTFVISAFITPYVETRQSLRKMCNNYLEVYISTPLKTCEERDVKGLYKKARSGEILNFTGISDPYEKPINPEIVVDTTNYSLEESYQELLAKIKILIPEIKL